jgi:hypothetical protein
MVILKVLFRGVMIIAINFTVTSADPGVYMFAGFGINVKGKCFITSLAAWAKVAGFHPFVWF